MVEFRTPLQPIYMTVPDDFGAFVQEVNRAFNNSWAPRAAFEEIFNFNLERNTKERDRVNKLRKVMNEDYMTNYMLDAVENGALSFINSLGYQWRPLLDILAEMTVNERRSFSCKIMYQRMQEMRLEEMARSLNEPAPFRRITTPLTPQERRKKAEKRLWDENMSDDVRAAYMAPKKLTARYGITVAQLQIRGHYHPPVEFMADFCMRAAYYFGLPATGPVPLPRRIERWTVIRSPFIFKKVQENFERRTFSRLVTIKDGHPDVVEMWIGYCIQNAFHGTGMKAHIFSHDRIGVGKTMEQDIKKILETDRWAVDGYNDMADEGAMLQETVNKEILRIESEIANRDRNERAKRVLQGRMSQIKLIENKVYKEFPEVDNEEEEVGDSKESKEAKEAKDDATSEATPQKSQFGIVKGQLPPFELANEVEWDKAQDNALRKHLLHVGQYARQKSIGPLTREEYFVYVPFVLLPKYKGIHKDVFQELIERDMLLIPDPNGGYLADWNNLTERQRYELVMEYRHKQIPTISEPESGNKATTSRLTRIMERRRKRRLEGSSLGKFEIRLSTPSGSSTESFSLEGMKEFIAKQRQITDDLDGKQEQKAESIVEEVARSQDEHSPNELAESDSVGVEMESGVPGSSVEVEGEEVKGDGGEGKEVEVSEAEEEVDVKNSSEPLEPLPGENEEDTLEEKQSDSPTEEDDKSK